MKIHEIAGFLRSLKSGRLKANEIIRLGGVFEVECFGPDGKLKWRDTAKNKIINIGLNHILGVEFYGVAQIAAASWYLGLTGSTPTPAAGDTLSSHSGWTEATAYSQASRPAWGQGAASGQQITNGSPAVFSINGTATIGGAFLVSNNVISGTTGTLFSVAPFSQGNKSCSSGDTVNATYTLSASSST
ncbi:MAG: hypothetical protein ABSF90_18595 [Syntrophobacteraceae bacterium]|jgi:hypothetical protein